MSWWKKKSVVIHFCAKCSGPIYGFHIKWGQVEGKPSFCEPCIVEVLGGIRLEYDKKLKNLYA